jgi:methylmalonyl-CoA mutase
MATQESSLFADFPPITAAQWRSQVEQDLKGRSPDRLIWHTGEGFDLAPYYRREDLDSLQETLAPVPGQYPFRRGNQFNGQDAGWQVVQPIYLDQAAAPDRMAEAADAETYALHLSLPPGTVLAQPLHTALKGVNLSQTALHVALPQAPSLVAADLYMALAAQRCAAKSLTGTLHNDPLGAALAAGQLPDFLQLVNVEAGVTAFADAPWFRGVGMDLSYVYDQGGTLTQQLAIALAAVVEYLDFLENSGSAISREDLLSNLAFTFPVGTSFFLEMAKFRAFRSLFARLLEAYDIEDEALASPFVMGRVSTWQFARYDAYNNLLRATTGAMSAVMGGVQALVIPPFDRLEGQSNATADRLARNIHHLLAHESYLDRVKDPVGGSYYLEQATEALAQAAWKGFQEIERQGGLMQACQAGWVQQWIAEAHAEKRQRLATRRLTQVGVNQYANPEEMQPELTLTDGDARAAAPFERLRLRADQHAARHEGHRLTAFLLLFGEVTPRNARSQFARNLLGAGGLALVETNHQTDPEAAIAEALALRPEVLVLCAADADYLSEAGLAMLTTLRQSLPQTRLLLAGKPEGWETLGVDHAIFAGMDAVAFLDQLLSEMIQA